MSNGNNLPKLGDMIGGPFISPPILDNIISNEKKENNIEPNTKQKTFQNMMPNSLLGDIISNDKKKLDDFKELIPNISTNTNDDLIQNKKSESIEDNIFNMIPDKIPNILPETNIDKLDEGQHVNFKKDINLDIKPNINQITKEKNKSSENDPLTFHDSSEVLQVPSTIEIKGEDKFAVISNTLDEAIITTILRDLSLIYTKLKFVVIPYGVSKDKKTFHIKQWDLWGPLILNLLLACTLALNSKEKSQMIILVFGIFWLGGYILYLNANFLGVKTSIFQFFCLLGYCLFPLDISAIFVTLFNPNAIMRLFIVGIMCGWSIYSSSDYLKNLTNPEQRYLVLYPCILFYLYISWFIVSTRSN